MSVPRYWREEKPRYRLLGERCAGCGARYFPRTPVCACGGTEFKPYKLPETGKVVSWTVIRSPPEGYEKYAPYIVALVELDDGLRLLSQLTDVAAEQVRSGMRVEAVLRKVKEDGPAGIIQYGYKFRPVVE
jgi:hypothetical protein